MLFQLQAIHPYYYYAILKLGEDILDLKPLGHKVRYRQNVQGSRPGYLFPYAELDRRGS